MGNRARASKLFLQFSGGKNHWTGEDMSNFCSAIWKQDGSGAIVGAWGRDRFDVGQGTLSMLELIWLNTGNADNLMII